MAFTLNGKICVTSGGFFRDAQDEANSRGNSWNVSGRRSQSLTAADNKDPAEKPEMSGRFFNRLARPLVREIGRWRSKWLVLPIANTALRLSIDPKLAGDPFAGTGVDCS